MTEDEARSWVRERFDVSRETLLAKFADLLIQENAHQNLISRSTIPAIWSRHIVDSAQLVGWAGDDAGGKRWLDIGSGAGLPGIVLAILHDGPVLLVEPRKKRVAFLEQAAASLGLSNVTVHGCKIEQVKTRANILTARAVANLSTLFEKATHCSDKNARWVLPKGRSAQSEVAEARQSWQGVFHVEQSITDPESHIVIAREVRPK